jgi:hypothetical protein
MFCGDDVCLDLRRRCVTVLMGLGFSGFSVFPAFLGCGIMTMHGFFVMRIDIGL